MMDTSQKYWDDKMYQDVENLLEANIEACGGKVRGAELAEEHLLIPGRGARARHPDGLRDGRHRAAVERVVHVLYAHPTPLGG